MSFARKPVICVVLEAENQGAFVHHDIGVCKTCAHHEDTGKNRWCQLLNIPLDIADAEQVCVDHKPSAKT